MKYFYRSDKGKVRQVNEDAVAIHELSSEGPILAVVADGMGGHQAGDVASKMAVEKLKEDWQNEKQELIDRDSVEKWLENAVIKANNHVYEYAQNNSLLNGMGTTIVASICSMNFLVIAHIGDSRAYLLDENQLRQVTKDHSLVGELVRSGQLSEEDALVHPRKNVILKALGTEPDVRPDVYSSAWHQSSILLLCSDGLTNKVSDQEIHQLLWKECSQQTVNELIQMANDRGGEDNITVAVIKHQENKVGDSTC
ncbi:Stp1/IreP family PP2C-type Ser/Thr phosphatase [Gracilibacillus oryzae]|uniref:protein-serine/threonine phosphatase n=1 Tax=Gracilibacillus oryzae TaxID=1672701 RepID=A0A7C8KS09_9BACI|nr:Stp1/IreP family PP2C-type Ser/Thr phosphatase [Gracilibacillus oryzae]KAB8138692.1 Stp1/IreP family PP2C-type Ser/Thr phosphatase [Gracilibacillus oryzae]